MSGRAARALLLAALAGGGPSCRERHVVPQECQTDPQCDADEGCLGGLCLPRAAPPAEWGLELEPLSDQAAGLLERLPLGATSPTLELEAADQAALVGTVTSDPAAGLTAAHVVLTVPALIGGRPDLVFETDLGLTSAAATPTFRLALPAGAMGRAGTLRVLPTGPATSTFAPVTLPLEVAPSIDLPLSSKIVTIRGRVQTAAASPKSGLLVRAFTSPGGALVSNVDVTGMDGTFTLVVPADVAGAFPPPVVAVDVTPPPSDAIDPRLATKPFTLMGNVDLGDLRLPAFAQPNLFRFAIRADTVDGPGVGRAVVRARTQLADDASGVTDFVREALTDSAGNADLSLLPGSTAALRNFEIAVLPPPDSPYAIRCVAKVPLAAGGLPGMPAVPPPLALARRTLVVGAVADADDRPVKGMTVTATRTAIDASTPCAAFLSTGPVTVTTSDEGVYSIYLDPGTYTLDYDPAAGAAVPRLTETGFEISVSVASSVLMRKKRTLPRAAFVEGTARDARGNPLAHAAVRLYEQSCAKPDACVGPGTAPTLRAQTRADRAGRFRAVFAPP